MSGEMKEKKDYWVYMLECSEGYIYTGIAVDPEARFKEHLNGKGSRFARIRKPIRIIARKRCPDRGTALRIESILKRLKPDEKRKWASEQQ
jgi:putative endonuclease